MRNTALVVLFFALRHSKLRQGPVTGKVRHSTGLGNRELRRQRSGEDFAERIMGQSVVIIELEEKLDVSLNEQGMR